MKVILISGASSGIGQATARRLAAGGHAVFGTSRDPSRAAPMPQVEMLGLDVRDDRSVEACVRSVLERKGRIDVLVNNAGYELAGALEETSIEEAKAQFETNFFGAHRMVRAVLPAMRAQGGGQVINITSLAGLAPIPFMGLYAASKFALEGYSEALRHEVAPFGIRVSAIEPGFLNTAMAAHRQSTAQQIAAYAPSRERVMAAIRDAEAAGPKAEVVAETVRSVVDDDAPALRYPTGGEAKTVTMLRRLLPQAAFEKGARRNFRL